MNVIYSNQFTQATTDLFTPVIIFKLKIQNKKVFNTEIIV